MLTVVELMMVVPFADETSFGLKSSSGIESTTFSFTSVKCLLVMPMKWRSSPDPLHDPQVILPDPPQRESVTLPLPLHEPQVCVVVW